MDVGTVPVEGYHEVLALHRYLFEYKGENLPSTAGRWNGMSREQRQAYVRDLLAPLRPPGDLPAELVDV